MIPVVLMVLSLIISAFVYVDSNGKVSFWFGTRIIFVALLVAVLFVALFFFTVSLWFS
jgi:hypothetical protein